MHSPGSVPVRANACLSLVATSGGSLLGAFETTGATVVTIPEGAHVTGVGTVLGGREPILGRLLGTAFVSSRRKSLL